MTADTWYVRLQGRVYGPYTHAQIEGYLARKRIGPASEISRDGQHWTTVEASDRFRDVAPQPKVVRNEPVVTHALPVHRWYYRKNGQVFGPYPKPQIEEYLILGRLSPGSEISLDGVSWTTIAASGYFRPRPDSVKTDPEDRAWLEERARARHRWLDERVFAEPPENAPPRAPEAPEIKALRHDHEVTRQLVEAAHEGRPKYWLAGLALLCIAAAAYFVWRAQGEGIILVRAAPGKVECGRIGAGVNWSGCDKRDAMLAGANLRTAHLVGARLDNADLRRADLGYADLERASLRAANLEAAQLRGSDLTRADLTGANLVRADLSYAVLHGARLEGVRLDAARLDKATWVDGRLCAVGSVGACR